MPETLPRAGDRRMPERVRRVSTYTAGSVIAAGCSEVALVVCYGLLHLPPAVSSTIAWVAGAVPNYWLNRSWTWRRRGRPSLSREVLPYAAIILATLLLAALATWAVDAWLREAGASGTTRTVAGGAGLPGRVRRDVRRALPPARPAVPATRPRQPGSERPGRSPRPPAAASRTTRGPNQRRYKAYQLELMRPQFGSSVLEVGAGLGEFAAQVDGLDRHVVTDVDPAAVATWPTGSPTGRRSRPGCSTWPTNPDRDRRARRRPCWRSTCSSTSRTTPRRCAGWPALVEPGGTVVIWVPGYMQLYGEFDRASDTSAATRRRPCASAFERAGLEPLEVKPVNLLGGVAWWLMVRRGGVGGPAAAAGAGLRPARGADDAAARTPGHARRSASRCWAWRPCPPEPD